MSLEILQLPRGGTAIKTASGILQIGSPPETIKDTIKMFEAVPDTYVIPLNSFSLKRRMSLADLEFPVNFNFFLKRKPLKIVGTRAQLSVVLAIVREALFGPERINVAQDYLPGTPEEQIPDLAAETDFLRADTISGERKAELSDMITPVEWGNSGRVPFGSIALERVKDNLRLVDGDKILAELPLDIEAVSPVYEPFNDGFFEPPMFGVTVIGSGSGFDVKERTSGFILWVNRRGILVDPPVDSMSWLESAGISLRMIGDCILTHCHADHDAGLLQKILAENKVNLHTTRTIIQSFACKYAALIGLSEQDFYKLFTFKPVIINSPSKINGGTFQFFYSLHSVPTIGFKVSFQGKTFVHSSDSLYDPATFDLMFEKGIINEYRRNELKNFPWDCDVIFHEAGVPPLHTPMENLINLPEDVKENLYLMHLSSEAVPVTSGLKKAPDGREASIDIPVTPPPMSDMFEYMDLLSSIDIFEFLPLEKAKEFLTLVSPMHFNEGSYICRAGDEPKYFYMVLSGWAAHLDEKDAKIRTYTANEYFGESPIVLGRTLKNSVKALTDISLLVMTAKDFLAFIEGSLISKCMGRIAENRINRTDVLITETTFFNNLSASQITSLQSMMERQFLKAGDLLCKQGDCCESFYLVSSGEVDFIKNGKSVIKGKRGTFIYKLLGANQDRAVCSFTCKALSDLEVYSFSTELFCRFLERNPGVFLVLKNSRLRSSVVMP